MTDIVEFVKKITNEASFKIRVSITGRIETYDYKSQKASIKVDIDELLSNGETVESPIICSVPIIFPSSGGASITMPVKRGDTCLLIFCDRDITNWLLGDSKPNTMRTHSLTDAVAIVGLNPFVKASPAKNNTDMLITYAGSSITLNSDGILTIDAKKVNVNCANASVKASADVVVDCKNASIKASDNINTNSAKLVHTGNVEVSGTLAVNGNVTANSNITVTGTSTFQSSVTASGTLTASSVRTTNGKILETHVHTSAAAGTPTSLPI